MGEKGEVDLAAVGVEGEAGIRDARSWRLREDAAEASTGAWGLRGVFPPDLDLIIGSGRSKMAAERSGYPLDLLEEGQNDGIAFSGSNHV